MIRRLLPCALALIAGCTSLQQKPEATGDQTRLGQVLVVASDRKPQLAFTGFAQSKPQGAVNAGASILGVCLGDFFSGTQCRGPDYFCGAVVIVGLGICTGAAIVAGTAGGIAAPTAGEVAGARQELGAAFDSQVIQSTLRDQVAAAMNLRGEEFLPRDPARAAEQFARTGDYKALKQFGVDTVLETTLTKAGLEGRGADPPLLLSIRAQARAIRTGDGAEILSREFIYSGGRYRLSQWSDRRGELLLESLGSGYQVLGEHIFDGVFRLYSFPYRGVQSAGLLSAAFGLAPEYPPTRGQLSDDRIFGPSFEWFSVDSLRPTLRWQAFPRSADIKAAPADMQRARNVHYDLVVARERELAPSEVVYRRSELPSNSHQLEQELQPGARYFWSVRASFDLDGRRRVTRWSSVRSDVGETFTVPNRHIFRFRTPG